MKAIANCEIGSIKKVRLTRGNRGMQFDPYGYRHQRPVAFYLHEGKSLFPRLGKRFKLGDGTTQSEPTAYGDNAGVE